MRIQTPHNSDYFRKKFGNTYEDFFNACDTVISIPQSFTWAGGLSMHYGGISAKVKLPTKVYIGIKYNNTNQIIYKSCQAYSSLKKAFYSLPIDTYLSTDPNDRLLTCLTHIFKKNVNLRGFDIHILCENDWIDTNPIYTGIGLILLMEFNIVTKDYFQMIDEVPLCELVTNKNFDRIFRMLWKIYIALDSHNDLSCPGTGIFDSLVHSQHPISLTIDDQIRSFQPSDIEPYPGYIHIDNLKAVDSISYVGMELKSNNSLMSTIPIAFGVISPSFKALEDIFASGNKIRNMIMRSSRMFSKIKQEIKNNKIHMQPLSANANVMQFYESIVQSLDLYAAHALDALGRSENTHESSQHIIQSYAKFDNLMKVHNHGQISQKYANLTHEIETYFRELAHTGSDFYVSSKSTMGDLKLFFLISKQSYTSVIEEIAELSFLPDGVASVDYLSCIDGVGQDAAKLELHRESKITGPGYIKQEHSLWLTNGKETRRVHSQVDMDQKEMLIDTINKKLILEGQKLNSDNLVSQKFVTELLSKILLTTDQEILSTDLPTTSYTLNKQEFQSKITIPLQNVVKQKLGKEIKFELIGGIANFKIRLHKNNADFWFLTREGYTPQ